MATGDQQTIIRQPGYIGNEKLRLFSWIHVCPDTLAADFGVIVCPPLGVDYMNSYRGLRHIADEYARLGVPAMRIDYLGCGDSADESPDSNQLDLQLQSIRLAIESCKREFQVRSVGLFGFKFGATLASLASQQNEVEFLSLWAPITKGKRYFREIRLLQQINENQSPTSGLEAGGLSVNKETENAWQSINLFTIAPRCKRILICPADEVESEEQLCESWQQEERDLTHVKLEGSSEMLVDAHYTKIPLESIRQIVSWSGVEAVNRRELSALKERSVSERLACFPECEKSNTEWFITESAVAGRIDDCFYVLSEPKVSKSELPMIIFLNSGANHHVGPNRIYVALTRKLAKLGFPCVRIDLPGIGDGFVDNFEQENVTYLPNLSCHIGKVITEFSKMEPERKFVIAGLCSGAYGAHVSAIELPGLNIVESLLINPLTFFWEEGMSLETAPSRDYQDWSWYMQSLRQPSRWLKLLKGHVEIGQLLNIIVKRTQIKLFSLSNRIISKTQNFGESCVSSNLTADLTKIVEHGVQLTLVLARSDPGLDILMTKAGPKVRKMIKDKEMQIYMIENADHTFSMKDARCNAIRAITGHLRNRYCK